jgi:hypothetical protein
VRLLFRWFGFIAVCVVLSLVTSGTVSAQSFFERLFGTGDPRPSQPIASEQRRSPVGVRVERQPDERAVREPRALREETATSGDHVQSMCVRTCDGFYWPVRFPVARGELKDDARICESTCGTQAKLYTRAGPGVEAEEMKDADGVSYGASATAFAYRRGLVNGCACRPMPWSVSERARHEGYALAEAETAIRLAQAEANATREAAEKLELDRLAALPTTVVEVVAVPDALNVGGPAIGPAEAAAIAAFARTRREPESGDAALVRRSSRRFARAPYVEPSPSRRVSRSQPARRRNAQVASVGWGW